MLTRLRPIWPLFTLLGSGALLASAHAFERFAGLTPCALCLQQRDWHWGVVVVSLIALIALRYRPQWARWVAVLVGLAALGAAGMAAYHVAVEQHWVIAQCDARIDANDISVIDFGEPVRAVRCDDIAWQMFGISMAGYNSIISALMALASFAVALWPERKA